jgi:hypothetical protein
LGIRAYGLDEHNVPRIQIHLIGSVKFFAAFHQDILDFLGLRIGTGLYVENIGQHRIRGIEPRDFSVKDLIVVQEDCLVGAGENGGLM